MGGGARNVPKDPNIDSTRLLDTATNIKRRSQRPSQDIVADHTNRHSTMMGEINYDWRADST